MAMRAWICGKCSAPFRYRNDAEEHEKLNRCDPAMVDAPRWPRE